MKPGKELTGKETTGAAPLYRLRLFVAGDEPNSLKAKAVLSRLCDEYLKDRCEIRIVDVFEDYQAAIENGVSVVPALIVEAPPPERTIVGSLSDEYKVLAALGLHGKGMAAMSDKKPSYDELRQRPEQAEATLNALRRGEVDLVIGAGEPLVVRFKSLAEENERLAEQWQATFDAANDAIWVLDRNHRILQSNRTAEQFFGKPRQEMIGRRCWEVVHGTTEPIPECPMLRAKQSLTRESMELPIGECWFEVTVNTILDGEGSYAGAVHIVSDITARKKAEEQVRESEEKYRTLFESAGDTIFLMKYDRFIDCNDTTLEMFACTRDDIFNKTPYHKFSPTRQPDGRDSREKALEKIEAALNGEPQFFEWQHRRLDGELFYTEVKLNRLKLGEEYFLLVIVRDITERKEAESKLKAEKEWSERLIDDAPIIVVGLQERSKIAVFNRFAEELTGYKAEEVIGKEWIKTFIPEEQREVVYRVWDDIADNRLIDHHFENEIVTKSGERRLIEWRNTVITENDKFRMVLAYGVDITARRQAEAEREQLQSQLLQAQKLEAVGRLAGGVAHDFNNMLSVILGHGEIVLNKLHPGDPLRDDVNAILEAGKRSAALIRQLLAFSRKQTLQPEVLDLNAVVRNLEKMLRRLIGEDIVLELALAEEIDRVMADPGLVEQVIMNLSVNARDAMPNGGRLLFGTANVELDETYAQNHTGVDPGKYVMLAVTDTGCGMDKETLSNVFEPFFTTKEKGKGTGLGLATVYGIVKQSGGNIWAYSEPGKGTTFKIYLPATEAKPEPKTTADEKETAKGGGEHILVVEDEDSLRKLAETALSRLGYQVSVAANGGEALLLMEEKGLKPDLVITDVVMPNMSGKELANRLQRNQPDLKVLYMSGYTDSAIVHHGILEPGTAFIQKPFILRDLAEKARAVLRGGHK